MIGIDAQLGGSIPQQNDAGRVKGIRPLFHSPRASALILDKTLMPGYGYLPSGTVLAEELTTKQLVPVAAGDADISTAAKSYAMANIANAAAVITVSLAESYKYSAGMGLILRHGTTYFDGGAIVSVVANENLGTAVITFTNAVDSANFTIANDVHCYAEAGVNARFSNAKFVLDSSIDTGIGSIAKGALAPVAVSNAILYSAVLEGMDAQSITDIGAITDGRFTILK